MLKRGYANVWLLYTAFIIFIISLILPCILKPIYKTWMKIAAIIGKIIAFVVLGLFFYLVIVPVGLFMKLSKRDSLEREFDKNVQTYWIKREYKLSDPKRIERQF